MKSNMNRKEFIGEASSPVPIASSAVFKWRRNETGEHRITHASLDAALVPGYTEFDVLSGRGKSSLNHPGNQFYQSIINDYAPMYEEDGVADFEKRQIQGEISRMIEGRGGQFLKPNKDGPGYIVLPLEEKRQKIAHALQYRVRELRKPIVNVLPLSKKRGRPKKKKNIKIPVGRKRRVTKRATGKKIDSTPATTTNEILHLHQQFTAHPPPTETHFCPAYEHSEPFPTLTSESFTSFMTRSLPHAEVSPSSSPESVVCDPFDLGYQFIPISESEVDDFSEQEFDHQI